MLVPELWSGPAKNQLVEQKGLVTLLTSELARRSVRVVKNDVAFHVS